MKVSPSNEISKMPVSFDQKRSFPRLEGVDGSEELFVVTDPELMKIIDRLRVPIDGIIVSEDVHIQTLMRLNRGNSSELKGIKRCSRLEPSISSVAIPRKIPRKRLRKSESSDEASSPQRRRIDYSSCCLDID
mmetsp:Transcript_4105/g.6043  ORF Transcript_4105/g.6043 Transcript_4105/m.6043 type:complete len:133 (-) Transcript_4105:146-544(-)|eukprot:CAMPEP_0167741154 /NCGR_PEP_ID=MMETSP0110_2-20121227/698_1 /TAXON_ID=629695 /ORGANISM="Gymnochlora sp., Strain CCMP2014" /LENGTH=132 /DNA_ID=CAMNT_0007625173 /DNA_START=38 /DNA_END=436 /DNA_ORIENTATION=-